MLRSVVLALPLALLPFSVQADASGGIVDGLVLPAMDELAGSGTALAQAAEANCAGNDPALRDAYHTAFDAWVRISHLRFGPAETDNRAFALAFWPDTRGKTPKALAGMIAKENPAVADPEAFAEVSIAAQGYYALEYMLFDDRLMAQGSAEYRCALVRALSTGIARNTDAIRRGWAGSYAAEMRSPGARYRDAAEVKQELFKALLTGLQMTADMRLGRPLGTFDRPRPNRAEARRSGRSLRHVILALDALEELALELADDNSDTAAALKAQFETTLQRAGQLEDPVFAGVAGPASRFRVEALQQDVRDLTALAEAQLGPALGVEPGFNSLDGD